MTGFADAPKAKTAEQLAEERFFTSQTGRVPDESDNALMALINDKVKDLARTILLDVPVGPNQSIALKALEDVQMRAIRAIFSPVG